MKNFARLFVVAGTYAGESKTNFVVSVKNDRLEVKVRPTGRVPYVYEVFKSIGQFLREYEVEFGERVALYERRNRYRFCSSRGSSGSGDTFIEIDDGDGFPVRWFLFHETCSGKCYGLRCFIYDYLDMCVTEGVLAVEDHFYIYRGEEDTTGIEMQVIRPRLTQYEEGWTLPWERPKEVVYLTVCRRIPEEPEQEPSDEGEEDGE